MEGSGYELCKPKKAKRKNVGPLTIDELEERIDIQSAQISYMKQVNEELKKENKRLAARCGELEAELRRE